MSLPSLVLKTINHSKNAIKLSRPIMYPYNNADKRQFSIVSPKKLSLFSSYPRNSGFRDLFDGASNINNRQKSKNAEKIVNAAANHDSTVNDNDTETSNNETENLEKSEKSEETQNQSSQLEQQFKLKETQYQKDINLLKYSLAEEKNIRARAESRQAERIKHATSKLSKDILAIYDDLDRFLVNTKPDEHNAAIIESIKMSRNQFNKVLNNNDIFEIEAKIGNKFDPKLHSQVSLLPEGNQLHPDLKVDEIFIIHSKGFVLHERVLRPAEVGVIIGS